MKRAESAGAIVTGKPHERLYGIYASVELFGTLILNITKEGLDATSQKQTTR